MSKWIHPLLAAICLFLVYRYYLLTKKVELCQGLNFPTTVFETKFQPAKVAEIRQVPVSFCTGKSAAECVPALIDFKQRYRTSAKYKLLGCAIEKNFSTMMTAILCFLHNETRFLTRGRNLTTELFHRRFCGPVNEFDSLQEISDKFEIKDKPTWDEWKKIAIVRHPFERFVSGFTDKCLREQTWIQYPDRCNRCQTNLTCFMEAQYDRMMRKGSGKKIRANFDDDHFYPQSWRCEFHTNFHQYNILRFETESPKEFYDELIDILKESHVNHSSIEFVAESMMSGRTSHSTVSSPERLQVIKELANTRYLMLLHIKMYYYDYVLFGFKLPDLPPIVEQEDPKGMLGV